MMASFTTPDEQTDPDRELRALMKPVGASGMATGRLFGKTTRKSCRQSTSDFNYVWRCTRKNHLSSMGRMVSAKRQKALGALHTTFLSRASIRPASSSWAERNLK